MFEVRYLTDWQFFEMVPFIALGVLGGAAGALFIKASSFWARSFRRIQAVKQWPLLEVVLVSLVTGLISYWNMYTKTPVAKLLLNLTSPCNEEKPDEMGLCPQNVNEIIGTVQELTIGFVVKGILTIITFGIVSSPEIYHIRPLTIRYRRFPLVFTCLQWWLGVFWAE
jgi:chloride channel 3/4/5